MATASKQRQDTAARARHMTVVTHEPQIEQIPVMSIRADGGTQMRAGLNEETVAEYREWLSTLQARQQMPPIVVYYDGTDYWLADGFHRLAAWREEMNQVAPRTIQAKVHSGDRRAAILHAAGANADHGLRRTNADKRRAVETLLRDEEWRKMTDVDIARHCRVDSKTVGNIRRELESTLEIPMSTVRKTADGRTMNTANIGRKEPPASVEPEPVAPANDEPLLPKSLNAAQLTPVDLWDAGYTIVQSPEGETYRWINADGEVGDWWALQDAIADARKRIELSAAVPAQGPTPLEQAIAQATGTVDPLVELMISPTVDITSDLPNSLGWAIRQASVGQLQEAYRLLPDSIRKGRGPVLQAALRKRGYIVEASPAPQADPQPVPDAHDHFEAWIKAMPPILGNYERRLLLELGLMGAELTRGAERSLRLKADDASRALRILIKDLNTLLAEQKR